MGLIDAAVKLIKAKAVKQLSETQYLVEGSKEYMVWFQKKLGRQEIFCNCHNGTKFCNSPCLCKHKISVLFFMMMRKIQ